MKAYPDNPPHPRTPPLHNAEKSCRCCFGGRKSTETVSCGVRRALRGIQPAEGAADYGDGFSTKRTATASSVNSLVRVWCQLFGPLSPQLEGRSSHDRPSPSGVTSGN